METAFLCLESNNNGIKKDKKKKWIKENVLLVVKYFLIIMAYQECQLQKNKKLSFIPFLHGFSL